MNKANLKILVRYLLTISKVEAMPENNLQIIINLLKQTHQHD